MTFFPGDLGIFLVEFTSGGSLESTMVSKQGKKLSGQGLNGGYTLVMLPRSAKGPTCFILQLGHFLQGSLSLPLSFSLSLNNSKTLSLHIHDTIRGGVRARQNTLQMCCAMLRTSINTTSNELCNSYVYSDQFDAMRGGDCAGTISGGTVRWSPG